MEFSIDKLPANIKLEISKEDLKAFALDCINQTKTSNENQTEEKSKDIITLDEACEFLSLARPTLYKMTSKREVPFFKKARKLYFSIKELRNWLQDGRHRTSSELLNDKK